MRTALALLVLTMTALPAMAQDVPNSSTESQAGDKAGMADLISRGFKIMAAVPNGKNFIVFLQKDTTAYACEFASLSDSRCGVIN